MNILNKNLPHDGNKSIFAPLSIVSSVAALISIPSIYGAVAGSILGIVMGYFAIRNNHRMLGIVGVSLNLLVLFATAVLIYLLSSYRPE